MERNVSYGNNPVDPFNESPCNPIYLFSLGIVFPPFISSSSSSRNLPTRIVSGLSSTYCSNITSFVFSLFGYTNNDDDDDNNLNKKKPNDNNNDDDNNNLNNNNNEGVDMEHIATMIMSKMGIPCEEGEIMKTGSRELSRIFEDGEPSLEEIKCAFDVFDHNRDGFIDPSELHRVLCILGLRQSIDVESCGKMIKAFDEDGDDMINFNDFLSFMQKIFC